MEEREKERKEGRASGREEGRQGEKEKQSSITNYYMVMKNSLFYVRSSNLNFITVNLGKIVSIQILVILALNVNSIIPIYMLCCKD